MKHTLIIVGEDIHINQPFLNYLLARYKRHFAQTPLIYYISDHDSELPFKIEEYSKHFAYVTIVANETKFGTISKILCTLTSDSLELKRDTLMPSRTQIYTENSFITELGGAQINLLKAIPTKKLPEFLLGIDEKLLIFYLLDMDIEQAKAAISPLAQTYNISFCATPVLDRLIFVYAKNEKFGQLDELIRELKEQFPRNFIDSANIVEFVASNLKAKNLSISFAESCTAGLAASKLGAISGASEIFSGSLVTYSNHIKHVWLGVKEETLETDGAVSANCVLEMAAGAMNMSGSDFGVAISGIAGPGGGTEQKPVGRVYIAVCNASKSMLACYDFAGDRDYIREQSALGAYALLLNSFWDEIV